MRESRKTSANGTQSVPNVIIFGETGAGKSSVINMLEGSDEAGVSDGAAGMTFSNTHYEKTIGGSTFKIFDTVGLNDASGWTPRPRDVFKGLYKLIRQLDDGVNLLVYVVRGQGQRITVTTQNNYEMFFTIFCQKKVPVVVVVTCLEDRENMDEWWEENKDAFSRYNMSFSGFACITATKGKARSGVYPYEVEYKESKEKVEKLIQHSYKLNAWKMPPEHWFGTTKRHILIKMLKIPDYTEGPTANVIVFGEADAGKSSVLNMLDGEDRAVVSDRVAGTTFTSTIHEKTIFGLTFRVFDTVGLDEGSKGTAVARESIEGLYRLIRKLDDGVNLLVYVMRASHVRTTAQQNYDIFYDVFCQRKVPIVIIITGLEDRKNMDDWWYENESLFGDRKFDGSACITTIKGPIRGSEHRSERQYTESKKIVESLIYDLHTPVPWKMPPGSWFDAVVIRLHNFFAPLLGLERMTHAHELYRALQIYGGLSDQDAITQANRMEQSYRSRID